MPRVRPCWSQATIWWSSNGWSGARSGSKAAWWFRIPASRRSWIFSSSPGPIRIPIQRRRTSMSDWLEFVVGEALLALRRNALFTIAAITTVAMALFLIGGFAYTYFQANRYIHALPTQLEVKVFLKDGMTSHVVTDLGEKIRKLAGESTSEFISKDEAWDKMRADHPDYPGDLENPLPDAYTVTFTTVEAATAGAAKLEDDPAVDKVVYLKELAAELTRGL